MKSAFWIGGGIGAALLVLAFVAAPKSCEGGLTVYFWSGVAVLPVLFAVPMMLRTDLPSFKRAMLGLAFSTFGVAIWIAGLFAANVRILCRLF